MNRDPLEDPALLASLDAADVELATDLAAEADPSPGRKPKPLDPLIAALEATAREAPSIERLATAGTLARVDADLVSGYLAVVTPGETWWAFVERPQLPVIVALLLRRPVAAVEAALDEGPVTLTPSAEPPPPPT
jgi:hypothetical protein